ncbi:iron ABC transporter permease [Bosea sp. WAO]|uniref:ABC transporter permease subunit n=1 Tax=Bosea sp. WAO TaxID=406341 RepID=UPI0008310591
MSAVTDTETPLRRGGGFARHFGFWPVVTAIVLVLIVGLLLVPVANIVGVSLSAGAKTGSIFENYVNFFSERFYYQTLVNSFWVSIWAMIFAVCLGVPAAYFVNRYEIWGRGFVRAAVVLTFVSPPFIGSYSWVVLFGRSGVLTQFFNSIGVSLPSIYGASGIIFVFTLQFFPFVFLLVSSGLKSIDQSVEDAARNLGSSEFRTFRTAIAPLLVPSITTSALLVFIASFTDLGTPIILGERFRVLPVLIYGEFVNEFGGRPVLASALSVLLLSVTTGALLLQRWLSARFSYATSAIRPLQVQEQPRGKRIAATAFVFLLIGFALLPLVNIVVSSFLKSNGPVLVASFTLDNYARILDRISLPLWNTLFYTTVATLLCAVIGTAIAYIIVRRPGPVSSLLDTVVMFSYAVPGIVLGVGLVVTYHEPPFALTGTATILILAYFIRRLPFSVRSSVSMLQQISRDTEDASINLGAGPGRTFAKITVPLLATAILSGALLTWSNTIRELSATLILQSGTTTTVAIEIFNEVVNGNFGVASALGTVLILLTFLPLVVLFTLLGKKEEALV